MRLTLVALSACGGHAGGGDATTADASRCPIVEAPEPQFETAYLKASNAEVGDFFSVVALSGDTLVVGAPSEDSSATGIGGAQDDNGAEASGAAYVFVRVGDTWSQQAYLKASNTDAGDNFGWAVAASGDTIVVGAPREDSSATTVDGNQDDDGALDRGAVYVFVRTGDSWSQQAYIKASDPDFGQLGSAVAIDGNTLVADGYVFARTGLSWSQQAIVGDERPISVSISGDTLVAGVYWGYLGHASVFTRSGTTWSEQARLIAPDPRPEDGFGASVGISGATIVVGARRESSCATGIDGDQAQETGIWSPRGAAFVFGRRGDTWSQDAYLKPPSFAIGSQDAFGWAVAVSEDRVVVGAPDTDRKGAVSVFQLTPTGWSAQAYFAASNGQQGQPAQCEDCEDVAGDALGTSVAVSGDTVVAGAMFEGARRTLFDYGYGAAYVFR